MSSLVTTPLEPTLAPAKNSILRSDFLRHIAQMGGWRLGSLVAGFAGSVWAARCLGPDNLGISSMITATVAQLGLLIGLNQDANLWLPETHGDLLRTRH